MQLDYNLCFGEVENKLPMNNRTVIKEAKISKKINSAYFVGVKKFMLQTDFVKVLEKFSSQRENFNSRENYSINYLENHLTKI